MFETLYGNQPIKIYLQKALEENRLPQTLLFSGVEGIGKSLFAKELAKHLLQGGRIDAETHPDLHVIRPEGKSGLHSIDAIRTLIDQVYEAPFESSGKVFILHDAERMQAPSANALLKTLEEPSPDTTIILLSSAPQEIIPTILSRCMKLPFQPLPEEAIASILTEKKLSPHFAKQASGSASTAILLASDPSFNEMQKITLSLLSKKRGYADLSDQLEKLETLLELVKEEDPVAYHRRVDLLFGTILMWTRDQHLRQIGGAPLFFPEEIGSALPLKEAESLIHEARTGFQRNIKLTACLERFFLLCH